MKKVGGIKRDALEITKFLALLLALVFYIVPFVLVILNSFKAKRDIIKNPFAFNTPMSLENYKTAFEKMNYLRAFGNSIFITTLSTILVILLASMCAYYIVRANNLISKIVFALMVASMIIPFQAIMIPLVSIYGGTLNMLNSKLSLIFMHVGFSMSMGVFMFSGFIRSSVPISLEEAAYIDGCNKFQTFFIIVLPLLKPITATLVILNAMAFWNDYLLPSLVLGKKELYTLPLSTYAFYGTYTSDYGLIMAGLVLTLAPILILYFFLQRYIISGVVAGAVK